MIENLEAIAIDLIKELEENKTVTETAKLLADRVYGIYDSMNATIAYQEEIIRENKMLKEILLEKLTPEEQFDLKLEHDYNIFE